MVARLNPTLRSALQQHTLNTLNMICGNNYTVKRGKAKGKLHHRHLHPLPQQKRPQMPEEEELMFSASRPSSSLSLSTRPSSSLSFFSTASTVLRVGQGVNYVLKTSHENPVAGDEAASPLRAINRRGWPADAREIWQPPEDLQRVSMPEGCTLFFPIELTGSDYIRRILDVVARCLQRVVLRTMVKCVKAVRPAFFVTTCAQVPQRRGLHRPQAGAVRFHQDV